MPLTWFEFIIVNWRDLISQENNIIPEVFNIHFLKCMNSFNFNNKKEDAGQEKQGQFVKIKLSMGLKEWSMTEELWLSESLFGITRSR